MKQILLFALTLFTFSTTMACPVYYRGKVYVVNEQMEIIKDVEFWQMNNAEDSFKKSQSS